MALSAVVVLCLAASAEVIDRVAVTVDRHVVTESEVLRQIRITAFLNSETPDFSAAAKRSTADRLVEQILIRRELESSRYTPATGTPIAYTQLLERHPTPDDYRKTLASYGLTDADIRQALDWQATLLDFIDIRFRPGVQVPPSEVREYYDQQSAQNEGRVPPFEEAREQIEQILTAQRVDNALDRWLGQARTQSRIRYRQEVFQ